MNCKREEKPHEKQQLNEQKTGEIHTEQVRPRFIGIEQAKLE
jgi:hypothetical protein